MNITFYNNKSNDNVVNKRLVVVNSLNFTFKDDVSIINPKLILKNYVNGNYCYISELKRYYYIDDVRILTSGLYELSLSVDVLKSYQSDIMNSKYYSQEGVFKIVNSDIDFNTIYDSSKFLMLIGG